MIEIVFGESACGSLKIAQTYGKGKYRGSAVSVFMRHEDGSVPSSDEMKEAQIQAQEQEHIAWENAIPLGGKSSDVYCFDMALSVGDISDNGIGEQRKNVLKKMLSVWFVEDLDYQVEEKIQKIKTTLSSVIERYVAGEEVRIWYSYNPDELCGMYWLMKQLRPLNCQTTIYLVKLPAWECHYQQRRVPASTTVVGTGHSYRTIADNSLSIIRFSALCRLRAEYDSSHGDEKRKEVSILSLLYL